MRRPPVRLRGILARVKLRLLAPIERPLAARIIASGMVDDPIQRAIHGPDVAARLHGMEILFGATLRETERPTLGAWEDDELLGVAAYGPPGSCPLPEERREALSQARSRACPCRPAKPFTRGALTGAPTTRPSRTGTLVRSPCVPMGRQEASTASYLRLSWSW